MVGLDAFSALQVVRSLRHLSRKGRTIVISIHQPRSEIWALFDHVILLARGTPLFSGPAATSLSHFKDLGHEIPPFVNPAEFLIDLAAVDNRSEEAERRSSARVDSLESAWKAQESLTLADEKLAEPFAQSIASEDSATHTVRARRVPFLRQVSVLTVRSFKVTVRDPMGVAGSLFEAVVMAVLTGWIFLQLSGDLSGIRSRQGAIYTASSLQGYLILIYEVYRLTMDIQVFDRERNEGVASVGAFLFSRRAARFFLEDIPVPLIFSLIFYFMVGFRTDGSQFFVFFAFTLLAQYIAVCLATLCVSISRNFAGASLVANLAYTVSLLYCHGSTTVTLVLGHIASSRWPYSSTCPPGGRCAPRTSAISFHMLINAAAKHGLWLLCPGRPDTSVD